jgi:hypothetical protein
MISTSVSKDRASAEKADGIAADYIRQKKLVDVLPNPPQITAGEVIACKVK